MTKVQVGEHRLVNVKRRSLCDNCIADVCLREESRQVRILQCDIFRSSLVAFKKCKRCGGIFEVFSNFQSLDYEMCQECNRK